MITEYTDCSEFMRLISDQKIKPSAVKRFLSKQGIILTSTSSSTVANDAYTILLGGQEMEQITQMIVSEGNYEKSTLINAKIKNPSGETNLLDYFAASSLASSASSSACMVAGTLAPICA